MLTTDERFWSKVDRRGPDECWPWTGALSPKGYGKFRGADGRTKQAHRVAYELAVGPIPAGMTIDHVRSRGCIHRHCVNPAHLEPVTMGVNVLRGEGPSAQHARATHCPQGHAYSGKNLYVRPSNGGRECRTCRRNYWRTYQRKVKVA